MERRFEQSMKDAMAGAVVDPAVHKGILERLEKFAEPFVETLGPRQAKDHASHYLAGLLSDLERKNAESIAYHHDLDRQVIQKFIGQADWDHRPLLDELATQVATSIGSDHAVIVFDPSAFPKSGKASVGVQRQWCGRLGKVENCQVGVYWGYVSEQEHALVDTRLYLPKSWATDKARRKRCGVPVQVRFQTRHQLCLEMLDEGGSQLPHAWIAGDDEMGRSTSFRRELRQREERYLLGVPCATLVRDLCAEPPPYRGYGVRPKSPFVRVDKWAASLDEEAWTPVEVRAGEKGPITVAVAKTRVLAKTERRRADAEETLVVFRERGPNGTTLHDYCLANAEVETPVTEFARVAKSRHRIEECFRRAKSEAGLADYEVRTWKGWHHHQTLSLLATWFLTQEARRGGKNDPRPDSAASALGTRHDSPPRVVLQRRRENLPQHDPAIAAKRASPLLPLEITQARTTDTC